MTQFIQLDECGLQSRLAQNMFNACRWVGIGGHQPTLVPLRLCASHVDLFVSRSRFPNLPVPGSLPSSMLSGLIMYVDHFCSRFLAAVDSCLFAARGLYIDVRLRAAEGKAVDILCDEAEGYIYRHSMLRAKGEHHVELGEVDC